ESDGRGARIGSDDAVDLEACPHHLVQAALDPHHVLRGKFALLAQPVGRLLGRGLSARRAEKDDVGALSYPSSCLEAAHAMLLGSDGIRPAANRMPTVMIAQIRVPGREALT